MKRAMAPPESEREGGRQASERGWRASEERRARRQARTHSQASCPKRASGVLGSGPAVLAPRRLLQLCPAPFLAKFWPAASGRPLLSAWRAVGGTRRVRGTCCLPPSLAGWANVASSLKCPFNKKPPRGVAGKSGKLRLGARRPNPGTSIPSLKFSETFLGTCASNYCSVMYAEKLPEEPRGFRGAQ